MGSCTFFHFIYGDFNDCLKKNFDARIILLLNFDVILLLLEILGIFEKVEDNENNVESC